MGFAMVRKYYEKELELLRKILDGETNYQHGLDWK